MISLPHPYWVTELLPEHIARFQELFAESVAVILAAITALTILVTGAAGIDLLLGADDAEAAGLRYGAPLVR
jgi:hypothetical protein